MKYGKYLAKNSVSVCCFLTMTFLLASCGGVPTKKSSSAAFDITPKSGTLIYIPVQKIDKKGKLIPYESMENPYLSQVGQIDVGAVRGFIAARKAIKAKDFERAENLLDEAIEKDKSLAGPWVLKGDIALLSSKLEQAENNYQQAIDANELNVNAYIKLGKVLRMQGKYLDAHGVYERALNLWKDFPEAHLNLAVLYDIYLNKPIVGLRHMEAYLFLTGSKDEKVFAWIEEIRSRTGAEAKLVLREESSASHNSPSEGEKNES